MASRVLAVTFELHPRSFFSPNSPQFRLSDETAKLQAAGWQPVSPAPW